jgi:putative endopeptidase
LTRRRSRRSGATRTPGQSRVNGTLKNRPGFYQAFGAKPGDKMYLAPQERVIIC